eukprot:gene1119-2178_t
MLQITILITAIEENFSNETNIKVIQMNHCQNSNHLDLVDGNIIPRAISGEDINLNSNSTVSYIPLDITASNEIETISSSMKLLSNIISDNNFNLLIVFGNSPVVFASSIISTYLSISIIHIDTGVRLLVDNRTPQELFRISMIESTCTLCFTSTIKSKEILFEKSIKNTYKQQQQQIRSVGHILSDLTIWIIKYKQLSVEENTEDTTTTDTTTTTVMSVTTPALPIHVIIYSPIETEIMKYIHPDPHSDTHPDTHPPLQHPDTTSTSSSSSSSSIYHHLPYPLKYDMLIRIISECSLLITGMGMTDGNGDGDGNGNGDGGNHFQVEAITLGVPVLCLNEQYVRTDGVDAGVTSVLHDYYSTKDSDVDVDVDVDSDPMHALSITVKEMLLSPSPSPSPSVPAVPSIYGDGKTVQRIMCSISTLFSTHNTKNNNNDINMNKICSQSDIFDDFIEPLPDPLIPRTLLQTDDTMTSVLNSLKLHNMSSELLFRDVPVIKNSITVILAQYRRYNIEKQLYILSKQSYLKHISAIYIYQNEAHYNISYVDNLHISLKLPVPIQRIQSFHKNFKFHMRFAISLLVDSEYTLVLDDDTFPGERWLEHCLLTCRETHAIVGAVGVVVGREGEMWMRPPLVELTEVDYVVHSWFYRTSWAKLMFSCHIPSWEQSEDMMLSACAWIKGRIRTVVPRMPSGDQSLDNPAVLDESRLDAHRIPGNSLGHGLGLGVCNTPPMKCGNFWKTLFQKNIYKYINVEMERKRNGLELMTTGRGGSSSSNCISPRGISSSSVSNRGDFMGLWNFLKIDLNNIGSTTPIRISPQGLKYEHSIVINAHHLISAYDNNESRWIEYYIHLADILWLIKVLPRGEVTHPVDTRISTQCISLSISILNITDTSTSTDTDTLPLTQTQDVARVGFEIIIPHLFGGEGMVVSMVDEVLEMNIGSTLRIVNFIPHEKILSPAYCDANGDSKVIFRAINHGALTAAGHGHG